jgi:glycosyltransferase involved in cell wall biosynthesis
VTKRILYVVTTLDVGGAERSLMELLARIDRSTFSPSLCSLMSGGTLAPAIRKLDVDVHELGVRPGLAEGRGIGIVPLLARLRPHLVHSRLILSNLWARLGVLSGAAVISEERGLALERPPFMTWLNRRTAPLCAAHVANSRLVAEQMRRRDGIPVERLHVIHGGVDLRCHPPRSAAQPADVDLICVARLEHYKGVLDLIEAMSLLVRARPGTRLLLVGDGGARREVEALIARRALGDAVTLAGAREDVVPALHRGRLFVLPSREEGLSNALLEAMACGLPVVATRVGGNPEVVDDEVGWLVPARDPARLAAAIGGALTDPAGLRARGDRARARVAARFDVEACARAYQNLYLRLLG